jgi:hypothetical protein
MKASERSGSSRNTSSGLGSRRKKEMGLFVPVWLPSTTPAIRNTRVPVGSPRDVDVDHRALIYVSLHVSSSSDDS